MKWNGLWVFIGFFLVELVVGWSNSYYRLILTVGSNSGSKLAISSSYNPWKHFVVVGSSQDWFSTIGSQIWQLDAFKKTQVKSRPSDNQKFKSDRWMNFQIFKKKKRPKKINNISTIFFISPRCSALHSTTNLIVDYQSQTDISTIFPTFSRNSSHLINDAQNRFKVI